MTDYKKRLHCDYKPLNIVGNTLSAGGVCRLAKMIRVTGESYLGRGGVMAGGKKLIYFCNISSQF